MAVAARMAVRIGGNSKLCDWNGIGGTRADCAQIHHFLRLRGGTFLEGVFEPKLGEKMGN